MKSVYVGSVVLVCKPAAGGKEAVEGVFWLLGRSTLRLKMLKMVWRK